MRNPFRFGGRWSWVRVQAGRPYLDRVTGLMVPVTVETRWWHPLAWVFVVRYAFTHVRIRIERTPS